MPDSVAPDAFDCVPPADSTAEVTLWILHQPNYLIVCRAAVGKQHTHVAVWMNRSRVFEQRFATMTEAADWAEAYREDLLRLGWLASRRDQG
jgi:hypothetical protein